MKRITVILAAVFTVLLFTGCAAQPSTVDMPDATQPPTLEAVASATLLPTATITLAPEATSTDIPSPTEAPTEAVTPEPTYVPAGTFAVLYYKPLVLNYDPAVWQDVSLYRFTHRRIVNYLLAKGTSTCRIDIQGPSGFTSSEEGYTQGEKQLGDITYKTLESSQPTANKMTFYFAEGEIASYDSAIGAPILVISANEEEWETCKTAGEEVLGTLHAPANQ